MDEGCKNADLDGETTCEILQLRKLLKGSTFTRVFTIFEIFYGGEEEDFSRNVLLKFCTHTNRELENLRLQGERLKIIVQ